MRATWSECGPSSSIAGLTVVVAVRVAVRAATLAAALAEDADAVIKQGVAALDWPLRRSYL
jgi:hypothetical protein